MVVGFSSNNAATPTLFTNFIRNPDGSFSTLNLNNDPLANANGINDNNLVVGFSNNNAFTYNPTTTTFTPLPPAKPGDTGSGPFGVNNAGTVVGQFTQNSTDTQPGFVYSNGVFTTFQATNTATVTNVQSVNNNGLAVGFYSSDGVHQHGFYDNTATQQITLIADPVVANLQLTQFLGVNDHDIAVGYYQTNDGSQHGFLYNLDTQVYTFLDDPAASKSGFSITQITGINDSNEIAGFTIDAATGPPARICRRGRGPRARLDDSRVRRPRDLPRVRPAPPRSPPRRRPELDSPGRARLRTPPVHAVLEGSRETSVSVQFCRSQIELTPISLTPISFDTDFIRFSKGRGEHRCRSNSAARK